jgi:riboflavin synthase
MFTGLIKDIGIVKKVSPNATGAEFIIETKKLAEEIKIDDSVATNGVCLTATKINDNCYHAQAVHVTMDKTNLKALKVGDKVNLELALRPMDRMGGHFVSGHINGVGKVNAIKVLGGNREYSIKIPKDLLPYMLKEGSIALDGISLTIASVRNDIVTVSIIPHTHENTILHTKKVGDSLNIEVDMMAKYVENILKFAKNDDFFTNWLKDNK